MHFGIGLPDRDAVLALRDRLAADGVKLVEERDEPGYLSVECRDPDGYIIKPTDRGRPSLAVVLGVAQPLVAGLSEGVLDAARRPLARGVSEDRRSRASASFGVR